MLGSLLGALDALSTLAGTIFLLIVAIVAGTATSFGVPLGLSVLLEH